MAAARAGVLGVRWLQRAGRTVVPLGARTGPRERARPPCGKGVPEGWCVGGRWVFWGPRRPCRGSGRRWSSRFQKSGWRASLVPGRLGLRPPLPLEIVGEAGGTGWPLTCPRLPSSLPHHQGHAPGALPQDPRRAGGRRQEV